MSGPPPIRVVLWNDGGEAIAEGLEEEAHQEVMRTYADLVGQCINDVLALPQFRHIEPVQVEDGAEGAPSSLSVAFDDAAGGAEVDMDAVRGKLDIWGLLLGTSKLPEELQSVAEVEVVDEESGATELQLTDEALAKQLSDLLKRSRVQRRYESWFSSVDETLGEALDAAVPEEGPTETPMDPFDVVQAVVLQLIRVAGVSPPRPSLLGRGVSAVRGVLGAPRAALRSAGKRLNRAQRLWWRLEDVVVDGGKVALKVALKAVRPVLVGVVLHRVLRTLGSSRGLHARLQRLDTEEAVDYYYRTLLGPDWRAQMQEDYAKALKDVDEGLVTDDINEEKRLMTAAQLRRLEVEEWDKQRMKNFYLASFGGLRWFDQMEQALKNPLFLDSRGWTDPVENWVGRNKTYAADLPVGEFMSDVSSTAVALKEAELGRRLTEKEVAAIVARGSAMAGGLLPRGDYDLRSPAAAAMAAGGAIVPPAPRK